MKIESFVSFDSSKDIWENGAELAKIMQKFPSRESGRGYFFDYGLGETSEHKRMSAKAITDAGFLMGVAQRIQRPVRVFRDMWGHVAARIKED